MPLINFKTDLTNLPWGRDKRNGGSSKEPYITKDIPEGLSTDDLPFRSGPDFIVRGGLKAISNSLDDVARFAKYMVDGASGIKFIAKQNLLSRTAAKTQAGGLGYGKANSQQTLGGGSFEAAGGSDPSFFQTLSNNLQSSLGASGASELVLGGGGGVNQGIYTPLSTLGQVAGSAFGAHLNLLGIDPTSNGEGGLFPDAGLTNYYGITKNQRDESPTNQNRLNFLYNFHLDTEDTNILQNIYSYSGGPGAILGIGNTNLKFADQGTGVRNPNFNNISNNTYLTTKTINTTGSFVNNEYNIFSSNRYASTQYSFLNAELSPTQQSSIFEIGGADAITSGINGPIQNFLYQVNQIRVDNGFESYETNNQVLYDAAGIDGSGFRSLTYNKDQLITKQNIYQGSVGNYPQDFRKELYTYPNTGSAASDTEDGTGGNQASTMLSLSPNYQTKNKDKRLNQGEPGKSNTAEGNKNVWDYGISALELQALDKINAMPMYTGNGPNEELAINDLIKFRIAAINNDGDGQQAVYMHFRAFLDDFSDSYTAEWNPVNYVGRGDTLYNYSKFGRTISLGFTTMAQSKAELIPMYKKLNYLTSTLAPDYTNAGFMRGNLVRLTVGGYLYEQPGFITGLTYTVPQESSWEIGLNAEGGGDSTVKELPHMIKVSGFSFTPIHTFLPEKPDDANNPNTKFIALANGANNNYVDDYKEYLASGDGDNNSTNNISGEGDAT